ncbi:hypothetical protein ACIBI4_06225 [Streptomyces sp. NPDC050418]|uniref:hypothetical protein n=1 Tax=Streptomyces sp. NPDC050418 TaxID=3365612 RepID=UPI003798EFB7
MNEGVAAIVAAFIAVSGVGLGLVGARWQYRGALQQAYAARDAAQDQANGAVRAAQEQAQAAIEAVRAQGRDQNQQWRRTIRRDVWIGFLAATDALNVAIEEVRVFSSAEAHEAALDRFGATGVKWGELRKRIGEVELEGPEMMIESARTVESALIQLSTRVDIGMRASEGESRLRHAAQEGVPAAIQFFRLVEEVPPGFKLGDEPEFERRIRELDLPSIIDRIAVFGWLIDREDYYNAWQSVQDARRAFVDAARQHLDGE